MALAHSYSSIKDFEGCGRRFHTVRILRAVKQEETEALRYGKLVHKAFEDAIFEDKPLDPRFAALEPYIAPLRSLPGEKFCEYKMGMTREFQPCEFFASDAWFRGVPDFLVVNRDTGIARVVDYKTGKSSRFADTAQLELMAAMVMAKFPEVHTVRGLLLFVVANDTIKSSYTRDELAIIQSKWASRALDVEAAVANNAWTARPSGLCSFCPLTKTMCEHR
jgi:hypothetical protein